MSYELPSYDKEETFCKLRDKDQESHKLLMKHPKKYHMNESIYMLTECGKGFITSDGHRCHMDGHNMSKRLKCTFQIALKHSQVL